MDRNELVTLKNEIKDIEEEMVDLRRRLISKTNQLQEAMERLKGLECPKCHDVFLEEEVPESHYTETKTEATYVDAGYGDDDEIGEVTRFYTVRRCPKCGCLLSSSNMIVRTENERRRKP